jgi:hypothetical protein
MEAGPACYDFRSHSAPVAQLDRATGFEPVGRRFESCRAHQPSLTIHAKVAHRSAKREGGPARANELRLAGQLLVRRSTKRERGRSMDLRFGGFTYAPVAQLDRATASGAVGHRFESCRAHQPSLMIHAKVAHHSAKREGGPARANELRLASQPSFMMAAPRHSVLAVK